MSLQGLGFNSSISAYFRLYCYKLFWFKITLDKELITVHHHCTCKCLMSTCLVLL